MLIIFNIKKSPFKIQTEVEKEKNSAIETNAIKHMQRKMEQQEKY